MAIKLSDLHKNYGSAGAPHFALKHINLDIAPGEILGVIGKSGAGKSTLIRCVNLLEQPTSGQVFVNQQELTALTPTALRNARRQIGMIFQQFNLLSARTVYQNIALPLRLLGKSKTAIREKVLALLDLVDLTDKQNYYPAELSGGQKQRVAIARALANDPKVLLCDEATSALDPHTTATILALLKTINQEFQLTILLITHEMDVVKKLCHRVAILDQGEIVETRRVIDLFTSPETALGREFVTSTLRYDLPELIQQRLLPQQQPGTNPVLRITFHGHAAAEPIISVLVKQFDLAINILQAHLEYIQEIPIGIMLIEMKHPEDTLTAARQYLKSHHIQSEVLGYVANDAL